MTIKSLIIGLIVLIVILGVVFFYMQHQRKNDVASDQISQITQPLEQAPIDKGTCIIQTKMAGRGLLEPMIADRTQLSFETGTECNILPRLKQNSIALYRSPRGPDPLTIKIAALPGDTILISDTNTLLINGTEYLNSAREIYRISSAEQRAMLNGIRDAHGEKIPDGFYVVMGDNDSVFLDSTWFGLADGGDILGIRAE